MKRNDYTISIKPQCIGRDMGFHIGSGALRQTFDLPGQTFLPGCEKPAKKPEPIQQELFNIVIKDSRES